MIERAYVRFREDLPENVNCYVAARGFSALGADVVPYYGFGDVMTLPGLGPSTIVCGNVGDVWEALRSLGIPEPAGLDYPGHLDWMLGRQVRQATLGHVTSGATRVFVKPTVQKLFTGRVWDPADRQARLALAVYPSDTHVFVSEVINFVSEWRCFVCHDVVVGVKHYKGDWARPPDREVIQRAVRAGRGLMPAGHSLDLGVTADGRTLLVEANEGYALGCYGLGEAAYVDLLSARWEQFFLDR